MKLQYAIFVLGAAFAVSSCFGIDDENYPQLSPISIETSSDTLNVTQGIEFVYTGMTVKSDLETTYEWAYGRPASGHQISDHKFASYTTISTSKTIDYTFPTIGSFLLRLKVDNGESIEYHYFTLNVNSGFDEGIVVLNNDSEGNGKMSFFKTLTAAEEEAGEQSFFEDIFGVSFPEYKLKNGTDMVMSYSTIKKVLYTGFLVATNDGEGSIYQIEPKTFEMVKVSKMAENGTYCREFGGENAGVSYLINFFIGANGCPFSYDYQIGYINPLTDVFPSVLDRCATTVNRSSATAATTVEGIFVGDDGLYQKENTSTVIYNPEGYKIVNIAAKRTGTQSTGLYILEQSTTDPTSFRITNASAKRFIAKSIKSVATFTADNVCMDKESKIIGTINSNDVYYTYNNAIYRWSLTTKPSTSPSITLPDGEQIRDIATNFNGKEKGTAGEEYIYVVTYNPDRAGDKKGSLYVYNVSDETLAKSYEGYFYDPASVIYKYRIN